MWNTIHPDLTSQRVTDRQLELARLAGVGHPLHRIHRHVRRDSRRSS